MAKRKVCTRVLPFVCSLAKRLPDNGKLNQTLCAQWHCRRAQLSRLSNIEPTWKIYSEAPARKCQMVSNAG